MKHLKTYENKSEYSSLDFNRVIKTDAEYEQMKEDFSKKIDDFLKEYDKFLDCTNPIYWRQSIYTEIKNYKGKLQYFEPITIKDLEQEWVRKEVLNSEEKELWNSSKKYNL